MKTNVAKKSTSFRDGISAASRLATTLIILMLVRRFVVPFL